LLLMTLLKRLD